MRLRFSLLVACSMRRCTCASTESASDPNSLPVSLFCTRVMTRTARELRAPSPPVVRALASSSCRWRHCCRSDEGERSSSSALTESDVSEELVSSRMELSLRLLFGLEWLAGLRTAPWSSSLHLMSGSCTKASSMASTELAFWRSRSMAASHVSLKVPSMPDASMAFTSMRVRRKGTDSGHLARVMATSKQSPKSMWITLPVDLCTRMLPGCLSPRPKTWPTMDMTARDRVNVVRRASHASDEGERACITRRRSVPLVCARAFSKTSTFCTCESRS
mmetsp:Transcript_24341/g.75824  ORF Transcript_24341/g.75824 Transcript_24341/m.75824 type:complete len:276 (+) Transcript_24341:120-947(+)